MKKVKMYTSTTYGTIYKDGIFTSSFENDFVFALRDAKEAGIGIAIYERNVYIDETRGRKTKKFFLFGVTKIVTNAEAISLNEKENLGYQNLEKYGDCEWFYIASKKALISKTKNTFALPNDF